ncbi:GIY-YIG nuclease family protein [Nostoc sp. CHAB 5844]|nr:GIY-YIG nuclease family protein [Nostoc sp. CHAB 5844]
MDIRSGIYKIKNRVNGKFYIGSSKNIKVRFWQHVNSLKKGDHHSYRLQADWDKFGEESFELFVIEEVEAEKLSYVEQNYLNLYRTFDPSIGYNICALADRRTRPTYQGMSHEEIEECLNDDLREECFSFESFLNFDKLIKGFKEHKVLDALIDKRPGVPKLPAQLYLRLVIASLAAKKDISACISTALETYTMRNEEKHLNEIKIQAAAADVTVEEYLVDAIAQRLKKDE